MFSKVNLLFIFLLCMNMHAIDVNCATLLRNIVDPSYNYKYRIDWELAFAKIKSFDSKFKNQTITKIIGQYDEEPIFRIDLMGQGNGKRKKIVILSGVHGNESIGVDVSLDLVEEFARDTRLINAYDFIFFPMVNPSGVKKNVRLTDNGDDLNRKFIKGKEMAIANLINKSLWGENIDMVLDLHEAVSQPNFFIVRNKEDKSNFVNQVLAKIPEKYRLVSNNKKYPAPLFSLKEPQNISYSLISPGEAVSANEGTVKDYFYDVFNVQHSYSIECPKNMDILTKKAVYKQVIRAFVEE